MRPAALQSLAYVVGPDLVQQMCLYVIPLAQQQEDKPVMHQVSPGGGSAPGVCPSWLGELRKREESFFLSLLFFDSPASWDRHDAIWVAVTIDDTNATVSIPYYRQYRQQQQTISGTLPRALLT